MDISKDHAQALRGYLSVCWKRGWDWNDVIYFMLQTSFSLQTDFLISHKKHIT